MPQKGRIMADHARRAGAPASDAALPLLARLRAGKAALHERHAALPLPERVRLVMELQRIVLPLIARRRPLRPWERPWEIRP